MSNITNWTFSIVDVNTVELVTEGCVQIPNILGLAIASFVILTVLMFLIARTPLKHKDDKNIRKAFVIICFIIMCLNAIMGYYAYTF